ncbi:Zn-dependent protease [Thiosulfatimonas sediminis]|uniref:Zn-dependent protease n=1 Tax=Thiosulfatimonas sediminis TaxID=2675054 RepID=A0A6F8PWW6_9GAMM|nr:M48 family metallopeptidase [Thiosulfatimonas sediminis]BBP46586.1 Zn-dependent protease [Thiosulfatimonas sediminis]
MDFFRAQEQAQRKTRWLLFWYVLILFSVSFIASLVLMLLMPIFSHGYLVLNSELLFTQLYTWQNWPIFAGVSAFVFAGAALNSWFKARELATGGVAIAEQLGAQRIPLNTRNPLQKRALNLVQEMAIAANMPVPQLYLLTQETAINAFAAGLYPSDAVITLTRGALERLDRNQLQGVIAHEFSHILNGDMRLNFRLIVLLHGIGFIRSIGRFMSPSRRQQARHSRAKKGQGIAAIVGLLLRLVGWLGELFSRMLQAKISREREYLADASAVQFTRNPQSIGGALKVLAHAQGRSYLTQDNLHEIAHLFFAPALSRMFSWYATHPPLDARIRRIEPNWDGVGLEGLPLEKVNTHLQQDELQSNSQLAGIQMERLQNLALLLPLLQHGLAPLSANQETQAQALLDSLQSPLDAMAMVLAVLLNKQIAPEDAAQNGSVLLKRLLVAFSASEKQLFDQTQGLAAALTQQLDCLQNFPQLNRLLLVELAMPSLKQLSAKQYQNLQTFLNAVAQFDGRSSLFESALIGLLKLYLRTDPASRREGRVQRFSAFKPEIQLLFSYLSQKIAQSALPERDYQQALASLQLHDLPLIPSVQLSEREVELSLSKLKKLAWQRKGELLQAMVELIERDGNLAATEEELILVMALTLEAPLPRFTLNAQHA